MKRFFLILALVPALAAANGVPPPPAPTPTATPTASATAAAGAIAAAQAGAASKAAAAADQSQTQSSNATASNQGNSQTTIQNEARSAPPVIIPAAFPAIGCGRGLSVGGAGLNGGGALAFNWANKDCEAFAQNVAFAQAFAAISRADLACAVLLSDPKAAEVWPVLPSCNPPAVPVAQAVERQDQGQFVTKEELQRIVERVLTK